MTLTLGATPAYTNAATLPLSFTTDADVPAANRTCFLNAAELASCASPFSPALGADGTYTYAVRVIDDVQNVALEPGPHLPARRDARLPAGASVDVRCKGKGCAFKRKRLTARAATLPLAKLFKARRLEPRTTIQIRVTHAGRAETFRYVTQKGRKTPKGGVVTG